jgi:arsenate reductase
VEIAVRKAGVVPALIGACVMLLAGADATAHTGESRKRSVPTVLFLCPHGAAKSVLASAYFQRAAKERGLNVRVESAGTDPDPEVSPRVADHLKKGGFDVPVAKPRRLTEADMTVADVVISIGCDPKSMPNPRAALVRWDDVPAPSEDFAAADARIRERVIQLVDELVRKQRR